MDNYIPHLERIACELEKFNNENKRKRDERHDVEIMHYITSDKTHKRSCESHLTDILNAGGKIICSDVIGDTIIYTIQNMVEDDVCDE
ncbi:hypothetical protein OAB94_02510 [Flavobacteriaceae bacterium]|nr:hypothetical protein [Flavobacteriaceae bacterium]